MAALSGASLLAGVVGAPVRHSLSPLIHNAWLAAAGVDGVYVPLEVQADRFERLVEGLRGGSLRGLNVTIPFKARALALADTADLAALEAGAANLLLFHQDGRIEARNTDGLGLLAALAEQAPGLRIEMAPAVVLGAGGAARGAVSALVGAGAPNVLVINRTAERAAALAAAFPASVQAAGFSRVAEALSGAGVVVNATSAGLDGVGALDLPWEAAPATTVVMDMVYKPLRTALLRQAETRGLLTVDGLAMLIGQARPSFEALFGAPIPTSVDVRRLALDALGEPS